MASLLFTCPKTRRQVPTGVETDVQSLRAAWSKGLKVQCPRCQTHEILVRETYIDGALRDATDRLRNGQLGPKSALCLRAKTNADHLSDETPIRPLGARMVCSRCGHRGADVRPDWSPHTNRRPGVMADR
jgi:DNA-directed RNA polymerase subunit RPC12/RpoP